MHASSIKNGLDRGYLEVKSVYFLQHLVKYEGFGKIFSSWMYAGGSAETVITCSGER